MAETKSLSVRLISAEAELKAFLAPYQSSSMFLLGNMAQAGLEDQNQRIQGSYLGAYTEKSQLVGVLAHYWNHNLILQAPEGLKDLLDAVPKHARRFKRGLGGILGPDTQVLEALNYLQIEAEALTLNSREPLFELALADLKRPPMPQNSRIRHFQPEELALLTEWKVNYACEALHLKASDRLWQESHEMAKIQIQEQAYWVLEVAGRPVSCSLFNTRCPGLVQIGGVWTPPTERGKAYARCVVAASLQQAQQEGVHTAILFTGEDNFAAIRAYQALGFQQIDHYRLSLLHPPKPF